MHKRGSMVRLLAGACTGLMLAVASPAHAAAPSVTGTPACHPDPEAGGSFSDLDGDGEADTVVGMPGYDAHAGAIDVRGSKGPARVITATMVGGGRNAAFGTAIAMGDLDRDGCADLVVSAPGRKDVGRVYVLFGGVGGIDTAHILTLPRGAGASSGFGQALALERRGEGRSMVHDLYVGAPNATVRGQQGAGQVYRYTLRPDRAKRVVATLGFVRDQDSPGVPGVSEKGDHFGAVLAAAWNGVLVGAPDESVGSARGAGAVWFLGVDRNGAPAQTQSWTQDSPGVPGGAEAGDHFGASLYSGGWTTLIGIPDEDEGDKRDSGMVQVLHRSQYSKGFQPGPAITQDSPGVPDVSEAGDRFGAAVAVGADLFCRESSDSAIGAPGEDVGQVQDAGTVTLIADADACPARVVRQGAGLDEEAEAGDQVGGVLRIAVAGNPDVDEGYADRLLIGVPSEDVGGVAEAGLVQPLVDTLQPLRSRILVDGGSVPFLTYSGDASGLAGYGSVLSSPSR
ncbi:FG-GAP repeat protein [Krasilnikovia sp. MM14-A1004]|uniref:FG-GAP and VCBS repeat-containing protein n=1 Tax=Krasilnikovia sp. MM14-A1004 TaxID=3373541 RepID=UPI00399D4526